MQHIYQRPYRFEELTGEAKNRALLEANEKQFTDFGKRKLHPLTVDLFMKVYELIGKAGINHFEKFTMDEDEFSNISFHNTREKYDDKNYLRFIIQQNVDRDMVALYTRLSKSTESLTWSLKSLSGEGSFKLNTKVSTTNFLKKSGNVLVVLEFIRDFCPNDEIAGLYKFKALLFDKDNPKIPTEDLEETVEHLNLTLSYVSLTLESAVRKSLSKLQEKITNLFKDSFNIENQLEYTNNVMSDTLSGPYRELWFSNEGEIVSSYYNLKDEFKEMYADWSKYENWKVNNARFYKQLYDGGHIKCENDTNNLMAPL